MNKKLLLTGINGFLGWNIYQGAKEQWDIFGTVFNHPLELSGVNVFRINLTDYTSLKRMFSEVCPDAVIHTAAMANPNLCEKYPSESFAINVTASNAIAGLCEDHAIPCIFTSSDLVFDGLNPPYDENDEVCPTSFYGEHKVLAESGMQERCSTVTICRMPLMFGNPGPVATSFVQPMLDALKAETELKLFTDEFRTPVGGKSAAEGILLALKLANGIIHLGGRERVSRYEFGKLFSEVLGFPSAKLTPCRQEDHPMLASRPPDVSFDSSKAYALGFDPPALREQLNRLRDSTIQGD